MNKNQQKILKLAKKKDISRMGYRETARELGIKNPQTVIYHLAQLRRKGLLYFDEKKRQRVAVPRAFVVDALLSVPIVGSANCGDARELAQEDVQGYLRISKKLIPRSKPTGLIAIRAVGESLNRADINGTSVEDGDYLIIDCEKQPQNNDYVLSVIDDAANIKKFYKNDQENEIRLISESTLNIPPIVLHAEDLDASRYLVNGVVIRVVKNNYV